MEGSQSVRDSPQAEEATGEGDVVEAPAMARRIGIVVGGFELTEQQAASVAHIITALETQRGMILAGGMGSGKTVQALTVARELAGLGGRVLFIVPAGLVGMWCESAHRFCGDVDIRAIKVKGGGDGAS